MLWKQSWLDGLALLPLLADLPVALPLQVLGADLGVDHDPLALEQHYDVGTAEHEEAELVAFQQLGSNLGGQIHSGNEGPTDRQHGD